VLLYRTWDLMRKVVVKKVVRTVNRSGNVSAVKPCLMSVFLYRLPQAIGKIGNQQSCERRGR